MENLLINSDTSLSPIRMEDATIIYDTINLNRKYLRKWLPFVDYISSVSDEEYFIKGLIINKLKGDKDEVFTIWHQGIFAGLIGFRDSDWGNHCTEIGYWLAQDMQKKGIITNSVIKLIYYAFKNLNMNRIKIRCGVGNIPSRSIPRKLGFSFEGIEREGEKHENGYIDLEVYSLLKKEWEKTGTKVKAEKTTSNLSKH